MLCVATDVNTFSNFTGDDVPTSLCWSSSQSLLAVKMIYSKTLLRWSRVGLPPPGSTADHRPLREQTRAAAS